MSRFTKEGGFKSFEKHHWFKRRCFCVYIFLLSRLNVLATLFRLHHALYCRDRWFRHVL